MLEFISLAQAQELVLQKVTPLVKEEVPLGQALARVLAEKITAGLNIPPFDRSPLDGYALRGEDLQEIPQVLKVIGEVPAGYSFKGKVSQGTAVKVLTGSPLPRGANAVIRQEDTKEIDGYVSILSRVKPGENISRQGEDISENESLFSCGTAITPAVQGVLASQGIAKVLVYAKPKIAIASSGDELVEVGQQLAPGQIYNSNLYTLSGMIRQWGGEPVSLGLSRDNEVELAKVIVGGLAQADLVVTTGGASVGEYDVTLKALESAGATPLFWRVAIKPGTPVLCGEKDGKLVLGLSGNPAAAMISAALLLGPMVRKLAGHTCCYPHEREVLSGADFTKASGVSRFVRAQVKSSGTSLIADFPDQQQPGVLKSMLNTNALVLIPPRRSLASGETCTAYLLHEWEEKV